jgi:two-component system, response regulator YesN
MLDSLDSATTSRVPRFLWVDLTREAGTALRLQLNGTCEVHSVSDSTLIPQTIQSLSPHFLCFEFNQPDVAGMNALAHTRHMHSGLPILMITGSHSEAVALWALRIRVWDLLVKPVSHGQLCQRINVLTKLTCGHEPKPAHTNLVAPENGELFFSIHGPSQRERTYPAVVYVQAHFDDKITLHQVSSLCHFGPTQFCRVFRQEQGLSFHQYLLHYRITQACERLADPCMHAKEVAYDVGFNDLSYFARAFKRQVGVCPSEYRAAARLS